MSRADSTGGMKAGPTAPASGKAPGALLDLDQVKIDPAWALKIPSTLAVRKLVLPFVAVDGVVAAPLQFVADRGFTGAGNAVDEVVLDTPYCMTSSFASGPNVR